MDMQLAVITGPSARGDCQGKDNSNKVLKDKKESKESIGVFTDYGEIIIINFSLILIQCFHNLLQPKISFCGW
jgi:hypothetical protein